MKTPIYVTKYLFTEGIQHYAEAEITDNAGMATVWSNGSFRLPQHFHGKEWHTTLEAARNHAMVMKTKKVESLKKKLKQIESMAI